MARQLFLVVGGELERLDGRDFRNNGTIDVVGVFTRDEAQKRWRGAAQQTVDNALMRYFIIPLNNGVAI